MSEESKEQHSASGDNKNGNQKETNFPIIVIGASAGGFTALRSLIAQIDPELNAAILMVWHMSPTVDGVLPHVLNRTNAIYAAHGYNNEPLMPKRIYVAPPDRHMLIEDGTIRITRGPKENRFRPAVDPLFRSAAYAYGSRVIGIILSGALDDGTSGMWSIKSFGGTTIVQDPMEAEVRSMPESALREVEIDHCLPLKEIAKLLNTLVRDYRMTELPEKRNDKKTEAEINIALEDNAFHENIMQFGNLSPFTCPECHGVLTLLKDGKLSRYRCHTGHAFSPDSLLDALTEKIEESLYSAIRGVDESIMLLNHMGDHFAEHNQTRLAALYFQKAREADERSKLMRQAVLRHEQLSNETILHQMPNIEGNHEKND